MNKLNFKAWLYFFFVYTLLPLFSQSQNIISITDSVGQHAYIIQKGDTVTLVFDSAYLLNKKLYKLYNEIYKKTAKGNLAWQELFSAYNDLITTQDSLLRSKDFYYNQLKQSFDSLADNTKNFLNNTDVNLKSVVQSLDNASSNLKNIKISINDSLDKLKSQNKQKVKLAVGGFVVGITAASLMYVLFK